MAYGRTVTAGGHRRDGIDLAVDATSDNEPCRYGGNAIFVLGTLSNGLVSVNKTGMGLCCVADEGFQLREVTISYFTARGELRSLIYIRSAKIKRDQRMAQSSVQYLAIPQKLESWRYLSLQVGIGSC